MPPIEAFRDAEGSTRPAHTKQHTGPRTLHGRTGASTGSAGVTRAMHRKNW